MTNMFTRVLFVLFAFAIGACSAPVVVQTASVCPEAVRENGDVVAQATITFDGKTVEGTCVNGVSIYEPHTLVAASVPNLTIARPTRTIAVGDLAPGAQNMYKFVYYAPEPSTMTVRPLTPFGKIVLNAEIKLDGNSVGFGAAKFTYDADISHTLSFSAVDHLTAPADVTIAPAQFPSGSTLPVSYTGNVAEVCFNTVDTATGDKVPDLNVLANGEKHAANGLDCYLAAPGKELRISWDTGVYSAQGSYYYPPNTFTVGSSLTITNRYIPSAQARFGCVATTPVNGEIFVVADGEKTSIGYSDGFAPACTAIDISRSNNTLSFGDVPGHTKADDIPITLNLDGYQFALFVLYDADKNALLCTKSSASYEYGVQNLDSDGITTDDARMMSFGVGRCVGAAVDQPHRITWPDRSQNKLISPAENPTVVAPNTMKAGETYNVAGVYTPADENINQKQVCVKFENDWHGSLLGLVIASNSYQPQYEAFRYCTSFSTTSGQITFGDIRYLTTPSPLVIDPSTLNISDAAYIAEQKTWEYTIVYHNAAPSALLCGEAYSTLGVLLPPQFQIDQLPAFTMTSGVATYRDRPNCSVVPVALEHTLVSNNWFQDAAQPSSLYIPQNKLAPMGVYTFRRRYVLYVKQASVCVTTTPVIGEVLVNNESQGWVAVPSSQSCQLKIMLDVSDPNLFSFSDEPGRVTPASVNYPAGTLGQNSYNLLVGTYK